MKSRKKHVSAGLAVFMLMGVDEVARGQAYSLSTFYNPNTSLFLQGINASGEVTGFNTATNNGNVTEDAVVGQATGGTASLQYIGYFGGNTDPTDGNYPIGSESWGVGINSFGEVAAAGGNSARNTGFGGGVGPPLSAQPDNGLVDLGNLGYSEFTFAAGINDNGLVVGSSSKPGNGFGAFVAVPDSTAPGSGYSTSMIALPGGSNSAAYGVNAAGTIIGFTGGTGANANAARTGKTAAEWSNIGGGWQQVAVTNPATTLGTASTGQSIAYAVNSSGDFVGVTETAHSTDAFLELSNGTVIDLEPSTSGSLKLSSDPWSSTLYEGWQTESTTGSYNLLNVGLGNTSSIAEALTDEQNGMIDIVGSVGSGSTKLAELWEVSLATDSVVLQTDLNSYVSPDISSQIDMVEATGINDSGDIIGYGDGLTSPDLGEVAFALTIPSSVPEPASLGLLAVGALGLLRRRSRKPAL
jgi:uncharacterized membrane protein